MDLKSRRVDLVNGGEVPFSVSDFGTVARAISSVLRQPECVTGHCVQVHGMFITQKETLKIVKKYDPAPEAWVVCEKEGRVKFEIGLSMLKRGEFTMEAMSTLMAGVVWDPKYELCFQETDNKWLGVVMLPKEQLEENIKDRVLRGVSGVATEKIVSKI
ncbi:hypothetical protein BDW62DRAFT_94169 [Aspergillus aurantiobrunneus]